MRKLWILALVAVLALGGATMALAEESDSDSAGDAEPGEFRPRHHGVRLIHGEGVAVNGDGETVDVATQKGSVSALDGESITVVSPDDFERTYVIDDDTRVRRGRERIEPTDLAVGDQVRVLAEADGNDDYVARFIGTPGERRDGDRPLRPRIARRLTERFGR